MLQPNCDPKVRFSYFLPDGILSSAVTEIIVPNPFNNKEILRYIGDHSIDTVCLSMTMEERLKEITRAYNRRHDATIDLEKSGYIISKTKKSTASKTKSQSVVMMTKSSLYLLTETEDQDTELKRLTESGFFEKENYETFSGNISYQDLSPDAIYWRRSLNELDAKKKDSPEAAVEFFDFLQQNLARYGYSPLVCESSLAKKVRLGLHGGPSQTDSQMRNMEIEAMFKFNRFLTCIDRPRIVMRDVEQDLDEYRNNPDSVLWLSTFTMVTLRDWYNAHLSAYTFWGADPERDDYVGREVWLRTPAYYRLNNLNGLVDCLKDKNEISTRNVMGYNATGVAVGVANNLMVYNIKGVPITWVPDSEARIAQTVQSIFDHGERNVESYEPLLEAGRTITDALFFCRNVNLFATLFQPDKSGKRTKFQQPFQTICIIPIGCVTTFQLRKILRFGPWGSKQDGIRRLLNSSPAMREHITSLVDQRDSIFSVDYNGTPVFVAHTMMWHEIVSAIELAEEGKDFLISCYPDQVKFFKKVIPNARFLKFVGNQNPKTEKN